MGFVKRVLHSRLRYTGLLAALLMLILGVSSLSAQGASSIAQGFQTSDSDVVPGALVSLADGKANTIELSTSDNLQQLQGIAGNKSLIELSNGVGTVQVVTDGTTNALVSDINGSIKIGDRVTASPIAGVGMKATISTLVIGIAQQDFSGVKTASRTVTGTKGNKKTVHIGSVSVQVDKVFYQPPNTQNSFLPSSVQGFANSVAGHQVSAARVVIAGLLVFLLFVVITTLLYSTVKSSIISIGRNPLSENAVHKSLLEVGITVAGVLVFAVVVVYLILIT